MKKATIWILAIYAVLVTAACVVFGTLYFVTKSDTSNDKQTSKNLTYAEAKEFVTQVYDDIDSYSYPVKSSATNEYFGDDLFMDDQLKQTWILFVDGPLKKLKSGFDKNFEANKWLKGKSAEDQPFKIEIDGQSVRYIGVNRVDNGYEYDYSIHSGTYYESVNFELTKVGMNGWKLDYYANYYGLTSTSIGENDPRVMIQHFKGECENGEIYSVETSAVGTSLKTFEKFLEDTEVEQYSTYQCDLKNNKRIYAGGPSSAFEDNPIQGGEALSDEDTYFYAQKEYERAIDVLGTYLDSDQFKNVDKVDLE